MGRDNKLTDEIDEWLHSGGRVVAASERAARAIAAGFHHRRRAEGLAGWPSPDVVSWASFVRREWEEHRPLETDGRLLLNPAQEETLWAGIIRTSGNGASLLEGPLRRLAGLASEAHALLCSHSPRHLARASRGGWQQDAARFSEWLVEFDNECRAKNLVSASRIGGELAELLSESNEPARPALLLAGFDRLTPEQRRIAEAWGKSKTAETSEPAPSVQYFSAPDQGSELAACAAWCKKLTAEQAAANLQTRLLVVTQDASQRRGQIERAFLRAGVPHEFSLGIPLANAGLARSALLLLQWLDGELAENQIDWLFSADWFTNQDERAALQAYHRNLRRKGRERTAWKLESFLNAGDATIQPPESWKRRMLSAQRSLMELSRRQQTPIAWADAVPELLKEAGWASARPGFRALTSEDFQAAQRWANALDNCGSLGFDGRRMRWPEFLSDLQRAASETLFTLESEDAPVLIAGPAESAGLAADGIWFLGVDEDAWPARGNANPLLPIPIQREAAMPHSTAQVDRDLAETITRRLLHSAPAVRFSYARLKEGIETAESRLASALAGNAQLLAQQQTQTASAAITESFLDTEAIPLPATQWATAGGAITGGSDLLSAQSRCPFQAFAKERLEADSWRAAEDGLTPPIRGKMVHAALKSAWSKPDGVETLAELNALPDLATFAALHASRAVEEEMPQAAKEQMPARYLEMEKDRLAKLVEEWLAYEKTRIDFSVLQTERKATVQVSELALHLRLDRVDRLDDDTLLVIDYKTGSVDVKDWNLPRPQDVQLPLYANFALQQQGEIGGLVFARVVPGAGEKKFEGRVANAKATLIPTLRGNTNLVKVPLTPEQMSEWKEKIEELARDFLVGRADVDPRKPPETCDSCGLQPLCRIHEREAVNPAEGEGE